MLVLAALLFVQDVPCTAKDADLPVALAGWVQPHEVLAPGKSILLPAAEDGTADTIFTIDAAGTYGIALDQRGWIDVIPSDDHEQAIESTADPIKSTSHDHGPACSSIAKIVQFELTPGSYRLHLARLTQPDAKVMLVVGE